MTFTEEQRYWKERDFVVDLVKQLPSFVFWKDKNSVYLGCNDLFAQSAGLSTPDEIIGKTDYDLPWEKYQSDLYRADDQQVITTKIPKLNIEEPQTLPDGKQIILLTSKVPLLNKTGEVIGVLGIYTDITDRKNMEISIREAKEKAETISQAKTDFLANMSHDVKTPLSNMIGLTEALALELTGESLKLANYILKAGQQTMLFFDNCIELSKLDHFEISTSIEIFDLKKEIDRITILLDPAKKLKNLAFNIEYDDNIPKHLLGARSAIYRILLNLLGNAFKFTEHGSITLRAKLTEESTPEKATVEIQVEDTGIGIPQNKHKIIFDRLTRLTPSYEGRYEGNGIGLYLVDKLVKALGGNIQVQSKEGKGSCFTVVLSLDASPY